MTSPYLNRRPVATVTRINPHFAGPQVTPELPYALDDLGDREERDAFPALIYKPAPPRDMDARRPHSAMVAIRLAALVAIAVAIIPLQYALTLYNAWRKK